MSKKLVLNGGMRYSYSALLSEFTAGILPYEHIDIRNGALTGSVGVVLTPNEKWQINGVVSTGFRNPNVDDYGKVRAKDEIITVPNDQLSPEYSYNAEMGLTRIVEGYMKLSFVGYYSYLRDAIVRTWFPINGQDSLEYDGDMYRISANYNAGQAHIYGMALRFTANLNKSISLDGTLNYTHGYNITDDAPLGHIPPIFGRTTLSYERKQFFFHTYVVYNGWKYREDFSPYGEDNDAEAMEYGYPSWWTLNLKTGYRFGRHFDLMLAVENLFDQFYKVHASGIAAPGRDFLIRARIHLD
jgi:hemoglobin/transferrin/lactoferrin receptor protein